MTLAKARKLEMNKKSEAWLMNSEHPKLPTAEAIRSKRPNAIVVNANQVFYYANIFNLVAKVLERQSCFEIYL